jgi:hypothetical protein
MKRLLLSLALVLCMGASGASARATITESSTYFGVWSLVEQVRSGEPAIMHIATNGTSLTLQWESGKRLASSSLRDDGWELTINVNVPKGCLTTVSTQRYSIVRGEPILWDGLRGATEGLLRLCHQISELEKRQILDELKVAQSDYTTAVEAMKARAVVVFGPNLKRCRPRRPPSIPPTIPQPIEPFTDKCDGTW